MINEEAIPSYAYDNRGLKVAEVIAYPDRDVYHHKKVDRTKHVVCSLVEIHDAQYKLQFGDGDELHRGSELREAWIGTILLLPQKQVHPKDSPVKSTCFELTISDEDEVLKMVKETDELEETDRAQGTPASTFPVGFTGPVLTDKEWEARCVRAREAIGKEALAKATGIGSQDASEALVSLKGKTANETDSSVETQSEGHDALASSPAAAQARGEATPNV